MMKWFCKFPIFLKKERKLSGIVVGAVTVENLQTEGHAFSSLVSLLAHVWRWGFSGKLRFFRQSYNFSPESFLHSISLWLAPFLRVCDKPHHKKCWFVFLQRIFLPISFFLMGHNLSTEWTFETSPQKYWLLIYHIILTSKPSGALVEVTAARSQGSSVWFMNLFLF